MSTSRDADRRLERQSALRARLAAAGVDQALITHLPNIRYLTGFTGTAGLLLVRPGETVLLTDFRYESQADREVGGAASVVIERANTWDRLGRLFRDSGSGSLGYEAPALPARDLTRLRGLWAGTLRPTEDLVEGLRVAKDPGEVEAIRQAAVLGLESLEEVLPGVRAGMTELEVAAELERALRRRGSEWHPFPTIVASGPRSALPHAATTNRVIGRGEWLLLDFGARVNGYCADLSRTVVVGARADGRQREVYEVVRQAQVRAREGVRAGQTGREADQLARAFIAEAGYGEAFGHSLGHGLGLEVHEAPRLSPTSDQPLPPGAVVTIEPGIYLPGWGGVRLEDDVHLPPGGPVLLSDGRTSLVELV